MRTAPVPEFKDAIFVYELATLPPELQLAQSVVEHFKKQPEAATTLVSFARTLEEAAELIDAFKAATCGSAYSLALLNINMLSGVDELKFLLKADVLGDPRTIFLASLRFMTGEIYAFAKEKVQRESETKERTPSCIDCYGAAHKEDSAAKLSELIVAYLRESEDRAKARAAGISVYGDSPAEALLRKSITTFYGRRFKR